MFTGVIIVGRADDLRRPAAKRRPGDRATDELDTRERGRGRSDAVSGETTGSGEVGHECHR